MGPSMSNQLKKGAQMEEQILVSVEEAARMIGVSKSTAYELVRAGVIPTVRLGTIRRVPVAGLRALAVEAALIGHLEGENGTRTFQE
jgi:excisionase family DNA binding protein